MTESASRHPSVFLAYPSTPSTAESCRRLAQALNQAKHSTVTWEDLTEDGLLWLPIADAIRNSDIVLAEASEQNANVSFEIGYGIGLGKHVFQLNNRNLRNSSTIKLLELVRRIDYTERAQILDFLDSFDASSAPLINQLLPDGERHAHGGLFFMPGRGLQDVNNGVWKVCTDSVFGSGTHTIDLGDESYNSLQGHAQSIASADVFVGTVPSSDVRDHESSTSDVLLMAGFAVALGKQVVVLAQQPRSRILDLGDAFAPFDTETQAEAHLRQRLNRIAEGLLKATSEPAALRTRARAGTTAVFLGHLDARADFHLDDYFLETPAYHHAESGRRRFFVGSKGSGKTALFEQLSTVFEARKQVTTRVAPSDFEFPRLSAILDNLKDAHWEFVYGSFWRFILISEIMGEINRSFLEFLVSEASSLSYVRVAGQDRPVASKWAQDLLSWIDDNKDLISLDFVTRASSIAQRIEDTKSLDAAERQKSIEDLLQSSRLYEIQHDLARFAEKYRIYLLIDDLDRNWSPDTVSSQRLISSLINAIEDLGNGIRGKNFHPVVLLRRDVFSWLARNDHEFLKKDPALLEWDSGLLKDMIAERIASQVEVPDGTVDSAWATIFEPLPNGDLPADFIIERTLKRPREVLQFCQKALETAQNAGRAKANVGDILRAWEYTGELILAQMETEYAGEFPGLGDLTLAFFERPATIRWHELSGLLEGRVEALPEPMQAKWSARGGSIALNCLEALYRTGLVGIESQAGNRYEEAGRDFDALGPVLTAQFSVFVALAFQRWLKCWGGGQEVTAMT